MNVCADRRPLGVGLGGNREIGMLWRISLV